MIAAPARPSAAASRVHGAWWPSIPISLLVLVIMVLAAPIAAVVAALLRPGDGLFGHLAQTVLLEYARNTILLSSGVAIIAGIAGAGTAWLVTMYRFPGRDILDWALVLPLAMPAYVLAYAYTDFLQVTGALQSGLRAATGWSVHDYWFPEIRSLGGAVFVLAAVLYPYVYVLARAAFVEQSRCAIEVSRTLGCGPVMAFCRVGLPLARPAIATGVAFVVMEAVADFGSVSFFGLPTLTTGIYRAWYALGSPTAAAQLVALLLSLVFAILTIERLSRGNARYASATAHIFAKSEARLSGWRGGMAAFACGLPLALGFLLPVAILLRMALREGSANWPHLAVITGNTLLIAGLAAAAIVATALLVQLMVRREGTAMSSGLARIASLGYAAPGAVIAVGIVVTVGALDTAFASGRVALGGSTVGLVLGGSLAALIYGYAVRFLAVAQQPIEAGFAKLAPCFTEAAQTLGVGRWRQLTRIELPLLRPALLAAMLLVTVDVMKELPTTLVLRPFDFDTLAVEAYRLATTERLGEAALPSFMIVLAGLVPVILLCRLLARGKVEHAAQS